MSEIRLTDREREMMLDIMDDQYSDGTLAACPWSWSVAGNRSRAAVLGSLAKKGMIQCEGSGRDAICYFTDAGKEAMRGILRACGREVRG